MYKKNFFIILVACLFLAATALLTWAQDKQAARTTTKKPAPAKRPTVTKPTTPKPTTRRRTASFKGSKPRYQPPAFRFQVDTEATVLYLSPTNVVAQEGEEFLTKVMISNPAAKEFDFLRIIVHYEPQYVEPLGIKDVRVRDKAASPPTAVFYEQPGIVFYEAALREPLSTTFDYLIALKWRSLKPVPSFDFRFAEYEDKLTALQNKQQDILGDEVDPNDGTIDGTAIIKKIGEENVQLATLEDYLHEFIIGKRQIGDLQLSLLSEQRQVKVGEEFLVHVHLTTPEPVPLDLINVSLRFDPEVLQVLDYDNGNWIVRGVNIFDGDYHKEFPFDYLVRNEVDNLRGYIYYKAGMSELRTLSSGRVATIKFRALGPSPQTSVEFLTSSSVRAPGTSITLLGKDILGSPQRPDDGLLPTHVSITMN